MKPKGETLPPPVIDLLKQVALEAEPLKHGQFSSVNSVATVLATCANGGKKPSKDVISSWKGKVQRAFNQKKDSPGATEETRNIIGKYLGYSGWNELISIAFPEFNTSTYILKDEIRELVEKFIMSNTESLIKWLADEIDVMSKDLQHLYENDEISQGVEKANQAYLKYGAHPKILRHFFRFNMRRNKWRKIDSEVGKILLSNPNEIVFALCKLTTAERKLRDAYSNNHSDNNLKREAQIHSAQDDLDSISESQHNREYWYWQGRWHLEWWYYNKGVNITDLKLALSHFEHALGTKPIWFVLCYKCIVLKLLENNLFKQTRAEFTIEILKERERRPKMPSIRTYRISSFLLNEDIQGLNDFLKENSSPSSATDFSSTIQHHLELIFYRNPDIYEFYRKLLSDWDSNQPTKA